ncbi:MAG: putative ABC transport system ATP-binding protein [Cellvibrionaceae bacterium]|jgi:putative ABC transport system ATP-binding protein
MSNNKIVRFDNLEKGFQEGDRIRHVLKGVSVGFEEGKFTALLGPSGSGKSTLLNLACGIEEPDGGDVYIREVAITRLSDHDRTLFRRDNIGFVFQFFNLIPTLTVLENIILPQELAGKRRRELEPAAVALLDKVGLADRRDTFPDRLSGGEQQRVAICRALAHDPLLVLADEPTGNLDSKTGVIVMNLLLELTREAGKTLIMATHSPHVAPMADHIFRVEAGMLIEGMGS